jgi:hypothetical protein
MKVASVTVSAITQGLTAARATAFGALARVTLAMYGNTPELQKKIEKNEKRPNGRF